jgi:hypothetical protein
MSNIQSYNALIDRFKAFASGHFILKRFSHGQIEVSDLEKFGEYPFMHVVPSNVTYAKGMKTFSFQIVLADMPRDKEDKPEYQREVLSDLQRIAEDLVAEITNHRVLFGDLITVNNVSLEPFLEEFQHTLTGWTISLDLLVPYYWDACSIPAEWNDFFESGSGGTGSILTFIDSITRDENGNVSLVNDEAEPSPNYYYGTNDEGVRGWYLLTDEIGLTCETIGDCQTIIDIEAAIDDLQEEILLKANTADISAVGFSNDYNDLDNKPTIPTGTVTSVGLTMPSAFSVANSPITSSGDIAVTGAGTVSQYVRGDGSLATFPSSTGGGASLSFYLNGSVSQGTFGGVAFREMDRTPILGAGTDFTIATNGYIQSFITDANVPNQLEIPAGNWNFETYFSASSNGGTPSYYIELYKWDGATLSLIASGSANPEGITNGTATHLYVSAIAVPQTTLALTDRLAVRIWVNNSGRTIKLHTENSNLSQVITTFSTGLTALNGLTTQVQNFATGTAGTDFGISSATSTHTFNLPTASATNRGALSSADWTTFNSKFNLPSLTNGSVLFSNGTTIAQDNANLFWDDTNNRLGVGTATPTAIIHSVGSVTASGAIARGNFLQPTLVAAANSDVLVGLEINPTFTNGAFTGVKNNWINLVGNASINFTNQLYLKRGDVDVLFASSAETQLKTVSSSAPLKFFVGSTSQYAQFFATTGNLLLQNGGTFTDAGYKLDVNGSVRATGSISAASAIARGTFLNQTLVATANNDVLVGLDIASTFTLGAFTGVSRFPLRIRNAANTASVFGVSSDGVVRWGNSIESGNSTGQLSWDTDLVFINGALNLGFRTGGTDRMRIFNTGNVGIGTTTDIGFRLDVNGTARVTGNITGNAAITAATQITAGLINEAGARYIINGSSVGRNWQIANNWNVGGAFEITPSTAVGGSTFTTPSFVIAGATGNVLINTTTDVASSILTLASTTKGFLPPRMTTTQKNAIASPATGLMVYDTTLNLISVYNGTTWITL